MYGIMAFTYQTEVPATALFAVTADEEANTG